MVLSQIIFLVIAAATLVAALLVVTSRNLVHSALWLIATLFGVAIFYGFLSAGFFAVAQVVIYIGAIAILFIFSVMLTRRLMQDNSPQINRGWPLALLLAILFFGGVLGMYNTWPEFAAMAPEMAAEANPLEQLGLALVSPNAYVLPFELASILLVAAMIGAIYLAWEKK